MSDLVVVGGGPVGLGTAVTAALAGMTVTVVEPRSGPIDKACGEGLMPSAVAALETLGVHPAGRSFGGIAYVSDGHRAEARFRHGPGLGVRRTVLSASLAARADELGVRRVTARAGGISQDRTGVEVAGVRASWLAAADGLHSPMRRQLGLASPVGEVRSAHRGRAVGPRRAGPSAAVARYGLRRHVAVAPWSDLVEVHWAADAEAYVTPVSDGIVGVAILCRAGAPYETWLRRFPALAERLGDAPALGPVLGAGPLHQRVSARRAGRAFLVGDAAGYVDALTGEGIAVGLASARALVSCLVDGRPGDYEARWHAVTRRYRVLTTAVLWASQHPRVRRCLVPAAQRLPPVFRAVVDTLA